MPTCSGCNGTGQQHVTVRTIEADKPESESTFDTECFHCKGTGTLTVEQMLAIEHERNMWCRCDKSDPYAWSFYDDGKHKGCIRKHHYHCGNCGKITQIG